MGKRRGKSSLRQSSNALRGNGLRAFKNGDYDSAIESWERVQRQTPSMTPQAPLAEAYFRRGLQRLYGASPHPAAGLEDLRQATEVQPEEERFHYHLGLALQRQGDPAAALPIYQRLHTEDGPFSRRVAYPLALALLQTDGDPAQHAVWDELSPEEQALLEQRGQFRRRPYAVSDDAPPLWRAVAALDDGELEAAEGHLEAARAAGDLPEVVRYYQGVLAARRERWDRARRHWSQAAAQGFRTEHLILNLGESYHRLAEQRLKEGDSEGTRDAAREALRYKPGKRNLEQLLSQAHQRLGYQAATAGQWDQAREQWQQAYELEDGSFRLAYNLALAYERDEEWLEAAETWRETLRRRPRRDDHPDAITDEQVALLWKRAAEAYVREGEYDEAIHVYRQAVKYYPDNLDTRMALVDGLLDNGQLQAAENELERILQEHPDYIPALMRMGEVSASQGYWWYAADAPRYWEKVLELDPQHHDARLSLFNYYLDLGQNQEHWGRSRDAEASYRQALSYLPDHPVGLVALGRLYLVHGDESGAREYFEHALEQDPRNLGAYNIIIGAWLGNDQPAEAWKLMRRAEAQLSDVPFQFYLSQADFCLHLGRPDLAAPWLERTIEVAAPEEAPLAAIGEMLVMGGSLDLAEDYLQQALRANEEPARVHMLLGIVHLRRGEERVGFRHFDKAERLARKLEDAELLEAIVVARQVYSMPPDMIQMMQSGLLPFDLVDHELFDDDEEVF